MTDSPTPPHKSSSGIIMTVILTIVIIVLIGYQLKKSPRRILTPPSAVNHNINAAAKQSVGKTAPVHLRQVKQKPAAGHTQKIITINDHTRAAINDFLKSWLQAWKKSAGGNLKPYFAHYLSSFHTKSLDHQAWKSTKSIRNRGKSWIDISIKNLKIYSMADNRLQLIFDQEYSSSNFSDQSRKELILQKTAGSWLISSEQELEEHEINIDNASKK